MELTKKSYSKPGTDLELFDVQLRCLETLRREGKLFGAIGVGGGKTLISMLANKALGVAPEDVLVLTTSKLRDEAALEYDHYAQHFDVDWVEYVSYTFISRNEEYFWDKRPKLIVADETHKLKNLQSKRTTFFRRYMKENPETVFVPMSGSITVRSILEYAHLLRLALGDDSPLPDPNSNMGYPRLLSLSRVIDSNPDVPPTPTDYGVARYILKPLGNESLRDAYYRLLSGAPGVVISEESAYDGPINIEKWKPTIPDDVHYAVREAKEDAILPNGQWVVSSMSKAEKQKQLAQGFYYYPVYLDCHDRHWRAAHRAKQELVNEVIKRERRRKSSLITPAAVENAFRRGELNDSIWDHWEGYAHIPMPEVKVKWISTSIIEQAVARAKEMYRERGTPVLLWYDHVAVREKCEELLDKGGGLWEDVHVASLGDSPPRGTDVPQVAIVSLKSHGTGLNLQRDYGSMLVLAPPANGGAWEQFLGRIHRPGCAVEVVYVERNSSVAKYRSAYYKSKEDAKYVYETTKQPQKLLIADKVTE